MPIKSVAPAAEVWSSGFSSVSGTGDDILGSCSSRGAVAFSCIGGMNTCDGCWRLCFRIEADLCRTPPMAMAICEESDGSWSGDGGAYLASAGDPMLELRLYLFFGSCDGSSSMVNECGDGWCCCCEVCVCVCGFV